MLPKSEVKYIQSLSQKKFRDEQGVFVMEGVKMADEIISSYSHLIKAIYAVEKWIVKNRGKLTNDISIHQVQDFELQKITGLTVANEVFIILNKPASSIFTPNDNPVVVALDQIQDPGNLGTIIRTCDWFGVNHVICSPDSVDAFNPKVVQSAMGSLLRVNIIYMKIEQFINDNRLHTPCVAVLDGESYDKFVFPDKTLLIIGNESRGVSVSLRKIANKAITIPRRGKAESLNAAVASAIILSKIADGLPEL
jgi:TrmH family RNA methyltransferase